MLLNWLYKMNMFHCLRVPLKTPVAFEHWKSLAGVGSFESRRRSSLAYGSAPSGNTFQNSGFSCPSDTTTSSPLPAHWEAMALARSLSSPVSNHLHFIYEPMLTNIFQIDTKGAEDRCLRVKYVGRYLLALNRFWITQTLRTVIDKNFNIGVVGSTYLCFTRPLSIHYFNWFGYLYDLFNT